MPEYAHEPRPGVSLVVPCYQEEGAVEQTVEDCLAAMARVPGETELIFVNDGSRDRTGAILAEASAKNPKVVAIDNPTNMGYGASLKRGIEQARFDVIVITDADGTYPNERIPDLVEKLADQDMVIGARVGDNVQVPLIRRIPKRILLAFGRLMSQADIVDINSGLRAIRTEFVREHWEILPPAYSFTTTITMAMHMTGRRIRYVPIDYHQRVGQSSMHPIRDTYRIFATVWRTARRFRPDRARAFAAAGLGVLAALACGVFVAVTG